MADLKKGNYKPIYFLMGEESYFIDTITDYIEKNLLRDDEKDFDQVVVYGADTDLTQIINTARQFPMLASHRVLIVKEAQNVKGIEGTSDDKDPMTLYAANPTKSTILVVNYKGKKLDNRKKLAKTLDKEHVLFESKPLYDSQIGRWITDYLSARGASIEPKAAEVMAACMGTKLSAIVMELEKLKTAVGAGNKITVADIEKNVGISKEFNPFELQNAIGSRDVYRSALISKHLGATAKHSIIPDIAVLYGFFTKVMLTHSLRNASNGELASALKVSPYFVKDYQTAARNYNMTQCATVIGILREYDAYSKGIDAPPIDDADLLREMVFKIVTC